MPAPPAGFSPTPPPTVARYTLCLFPRSLRHWPGVWGLLPALSCFCSPLPPVASVGVLSAAATWGLALPTPEQGLSSGSAVSRLSSLTGPERQVQGAHAWAGSQRKDLAGHIRSLMV